MVEVTKIEVFETSLKELWDIITNNEDYAWRTDLSKITIVDNTHFIEYTKKGYPTFFTITNQKPYEEYEFDIENTNMKGHWSGKIQKNDEKTVIMTLTETIQVNHWIMRLLVKPYLKMQQNLYIKDLKQKILEKKG